MLNAPFLSCFASYLTKFAQQRLSTAPYLETYHLAVFDLNRKYRYRTGLPMIIVPSCIIFGSAYSTSYTRAESDKPNRYRCAPKRADFPRLGQLVGLSIATISERITIGVSAYLHQSKNEHYTVHISLPICHSSKYLRSTIRNRAFSGPVYAAPIQSPQ
jgi:hypothetical protein